MEEETHQITSESLSDSLPPGSMSMTMSTMHMKMGAMPIQMGMGMDFVQPSGFLHQSFQMSGGELLSMNDDNPNAVHMMPLE